MAESSVGQPVSDCQQGYHVGGGTGTLVVPKREQGGGTAVSNCFLTSGGLGPTAWGLQTGPQSCWCVCQPEG